MSKLNNKLLLIVLCSTVNISAKQRDASIAPELDPIENQKSTISFTPELDLNFLNSDWVNTQASYSPCTGYYQIPTLPKVSMPEISAESSELAKTGVSKLKGNVIFLDNNQKISADEATAYRDPKLNKVTEVVVNKNVEYLSPNLRAITKQAKANLPSETITIDSDIFYRYYPNYARGKAKKGVFVKDKSYSIFDAIYTTCQPGYSDWEIHAKEIHIDPNAQIGTAKHTFIYFYDIPIFYSPYLSFPTSKQRKSGFLMPIYNSSDRYGYSIAEPYYLNLAPNYDLTVTPRYMTKRGTQFQFESRYLSSYGDNILNFEFLPDDRDFAAFKKVHLHNPPSDMSFHDPRLSGLRHAYPQRYAVKLKDHKQWTPYLSSNIEYNYFSDNQYIIDLPPSELYRKQAENHFLQQGRVNYLYKEWEASALVKGYQTLHTLEGPTLKEPYRIMPGLSFGNRDLFNYNLESLTNLPLSLTTSFDSHIMRFATPLHPAPNKTAEGQRYYFKPAISTPFKKPYGYMIPKIAINVRHYNLNKLNESSTSLRYNDNQHYNIPIYSLDNGLYFDRTFSFKNTQYNQTLEPRLFYIFIPLRKQNQAPDFDIKQSTLTYDQLFRDNSFYGFDRQSNANQLTAGLTSRFQNLDNGMQYLMLQLGQAFYFQNKKVTICDRNIKSNCIESEIPDYKTRLSPLISELNINFEPQVIGRAEWQWDYLLNKTKKVNIGLHYVKPNNYKAPQPLFNLEYNFLKEGNIQTNIAGDKLYKPNNQHNNLSEIESSINLPVHRNINILGFTSYDLQQYATLDNYIGAELQKCCWAIRFGYRNQLRLRTNSLAKKKYDTIYSIQFSLKGLGELNESYESTLRSNIPGYTNYLNTIY